MGERAMREVKSLWIGIALLLAAGAPSALFSQEKSAAPAPAKQSQPAKKAAQKQAKPAGQKPTAAKPKPRTSPAAASRSFAQDIGTQLGFAGTTTGGRSVFGGTQQVGTSELASTPPPPLVVAGTDSLPLAVNLAAQAPTSGVLFAHRSPNFAIDFIITAAEAKGVGKLLSKPKVITQNNEKAVVKQGTKIPIQTTINNTISVQFIDAVLKLEVTPQITAEGTVFMDVLVENTQIDSGIPRVQGIPALNTQSAETKVLVADGGTVVIGGIIISQQRVDITQVPLVGSVPLIGHLFRRTNTSIQSQELLFFLTPRIIPG